MTSSSTSTVHSPDYRARFSADLKKSLPRIPRVAAREEFEAFARAGRELSDLHLHYEDVEPYPLTITGDDPKGDPYAWYAVEKMTYGKVRRDGRRVDDKSTIIYNPRITVSGIPEGAQEYMLGARSVLDWVVERYRIRTDKASGIVNDPHDWSREAGDPRYILSLIESLTTVSLRTQQIVNSLPSLEV